MTVEACARLRDSRRSDRLRRPGVARWAWRDQQQPGTQRQRTLMISVRVEASSLAARPFGTAGTALHVPQRLFNAKLAVGVGPPAS